MSEAKSKNKDLTVGEPQKVLWRFCLPLFASVIFQQLYNLADSWVAGRFIGEDALASVGNSYEITLIFLAFAFGCNIGCSVITSRYFGAKEYKDMKTAITTSMLSTLVLCITLMTAGLLFGGKLLLLINTPADLFSPSLTYLNIYCIGLPFVFFYNLANGIFSALGDSKTPFYFLAVSSVVNIFADILFVTVFKMGIAGVAWATLICQGISCLLAIYFVIKRLKSIKTNENAPLFSSRIFKQFLIIAIPSICQQSFISIGNIIIQGVINSFGSGVMAGYSAGVKLNNLVITSFTTLANGISNYASQNIGAQKYERIHQGFKAGIKLIWYLTIPMCIIYLIFTPQLLRFFLEEPSNAALASGTLYLRILAPFYFIVSAKLVADGFLRGSGMMRQFIFTTFTDLILRVTLAIILSSTALGFLGIWLSWPIGWTVGTSLSLMFYWRRFAFREQKGK